MKARLRRTARSFAAVFVAFWTYRFLVAPWIDPSFVIDETSVAGNVDIGSIRGADRERVKKYERIFPPGSWELDEPIMLESEGVELLMKDYENLGGGQIRLSQCTMLYLSSDAASAQQPGRVVILRAPEGAILQFDAEMNLRRGKVGKLIGGKLNGPVTIHGTPSKPGADDALYVATRDVSMDGKEIFSNHAVEFHYGPNDGRGQGLRIDLLPSAGGSGRRRGPNIGGMESIELVRDVQMSFEPGSTGLFPGDQNDAAAGVPLPDPVTGHVAGPSPVEIRCQGPFRFDLSQRQATFRDQVTVQRVMGPGVVDQSECSELQIFFGDRQRSDAALPQPPPVEQPATVAAADTSRLALQVERFIATGQPAIVRAPSSGMYVVGNHLEYELRRRRIVVQAAPRQPDADIKWNDNEFGGRSLVVERPQEKSLPLVTSAGPGWFNIRDPENPTAALKASWTRELNMRPVEGRHQVTLQGNAQTSSPQMGTLQAGQIDLWLVQLDRPRAQTAVARHQAGNIGLAPNAPKRSPRAPATIPVTPARLLAIGNVEFHAPQLNGDAQQLDIEFDPQGTLLPTPARTNTARQGMLGGLLERSGDSAGLAAQSQHGDPARAQATLRTTIADDAGAASGAPIAPVENGLPERAPRRFELHGNSILVKLVSHGEQTDVNHVEINGRVQLLETSGNQPGERPVEVRGDWLQVQNAAAPAQTLVVVTGKPGMIAARGMEMHGGTINLDRGHNRLWINGAGRTVLPPSRTANSPAAVAPRRSQSSPLFELSGGPVQIDFAGGMVFDGQTARYERDVLVHSQSQEVNDPHGLETLRRELKTDAVKVLLRTPIDFTAEQSADDAQVETLACIGPVLMTEQTSDKRGLTAVASISTRDLSVRQSTGEVHAFGPGSLKSTRLDSANPLFSPAAARPSSEKTADQPIFTRVDYQGPITGNLHDQKLELHDDIRGVYGPVKLWDQELPLNPNPIAAGQVLFSADKLIVSRPPGGDPKTRSLELAAQGNTRVDGQTFSATAHELTYVQGKEQLILKGAGPTAGAGHNDAILYFQPVPGGPQNEMRAGTIYYWPSTNRIDVKDGRNLQYFDHGRPQAAANRSTSTWATHAIPNTQ